MDTDPHPALVHGSDHHPSLGADGADGRPRADRGVCRPLPPAALPRDIEETFHLSHPTVSGLLSRLEQKGFLRLQPDPEDRRCKRIFLQEKGVQCHERIGSLIRDHEQRLVRGFTPQEREQFTSFLQRAIENLGGSPCPSLTEEEPKA